MDTYAAANIMMKHTQSVSDQTIIQERRKPVRKETKKNEHLKKPF